MDQEAFQQMLKSELQQAVAAACTEERTLLGRHSFLLGWLMGSAKLSTDEHAAICERLTTYSRGVSGGGDVA